MFGWRGNLKEEEKSRGDFRREKKFYLFEFERKK